MVVLGEEYGREVDTRERCSIDETSRTINRETAERRLEDNTIEEIKEMIIKSELRAILAIVSISRCLPTQDNIDRHVVSLSRRFERGSRVAFLFFLFPGANAFVKIDAFTARRENVRCLSPRCNRALNRSFAATAT